MDALTDLLEYDRQHKIKKASLNKTAASPIPMTHMPQYLAQPMSIPAQIGLSAGGTLGSAVAAVAINEVYGAIKSAITRKRDFKRMMDTNPDLAQLDEHTVKSLFNTIHQTAPTLSSNPIISGSMVRKYQVASGYLDPKLILDLANSELATRKSQELVSADALIKGMAGKLTYPSHIETVFP